MQSSEFDLGHHAYAMLEQIDRLNWKLHKIEVTDKTKFTERLQDRSSAQA